MTPPLHIVVLDGADHRVLSELMAAGRMPALADVRGRGTQVQADTIGGIFEEGVWPSVFSGMSLGEHGSQHFTQFVPETHGLRIRREPDQIEPFWMHLPGRGAGVLALDVPQMHPHDRSGADEICGWSSWSAPHPTDSRPPSVREQLGSVDDDWFHEFDQEPTLEDERRMSARLGALARTRLSRVAPMLDRRPVSCIGVQELHGAAHVLAHHWLDDHPHRPWPMEPHLVTDVYEAVDSGLGAVVADPADNVVVIASQGFTPANSSNPVLDGLLERAGLAVPPGQDPEGGGGGARRVSFDPMILLRRWISPELRERLAVRFLPESIQQRLMSQQFRDRFDWSQTRAFCTPSWTSGYLRVNLAGREQFGIVAPTDYDALLDELTDLVRGLSDAATGLPLVKDVLRIRDRFPGPKVDELPDLVVEWASDRPVRRVTHPMLGEWEADSVYHRYRWSDHHGHGVAFMAGPDIRPSDDEHTVDILGAAATFLRLAGVRPPSTMPAEWDEVLA